MVNLLLCILFSASLIIIFKLFHKYQVSASQGIFINYVTCTLIGAFIFGNSFSKIAEAGFSAPWVLAGMVAGFLFFVTFYLIAESTKLAGITATSVAQKVSLVIPVAASLLFWQPQHTLSTATICGLLLAVTAVVLSSWKKNKSEPTDQHQDKHGLFVLFLPAIVFVNAGLVDTLFNYTNHRFLNPDLEPSFTMVVFGTAAFLGLAAQVYEVGIKRCSFTGKSMLAGVVLGIPNLFTLIFLLRSLTSFNNNGALVYPVVNIGVIVVSALAGILFFGERLRKINWLGILLALASLGLLLAEAI